MSERGNNLMKFCDRYLGIPIVFMLGLIRQKKKFDKNLLKQKDLRFLVLKTAAIGDTIVLSAVIRELKARFPSAKITLICSKSNYSAVKLIKEIDNIAIFEMSHPLKSLRVISKLPEHDLLFDFSPWDKIDAVIAYFSRTKFRIGFRRRKMSRHYIYDIAVEHQDSVHEIENYRNLLRSVNIQPTGLIPEISITMEKFPFINNLLARNQPNIILHPFPGGIKKEFKEWPLDNWVKLGQKLIEENYKVFVSGGKEDFEQADYIREQIEKNGKQCSVLAGKYSLEETAAILKRSSLLVTVNTGIMHLGAAVGAKVIALHGPTSPKRWGPLCKNAVIVAPKLKCAPCLSLGFEYACKQGGCMESIEIEWVFDECNSYLG